MWRVWSHDGILSKEGSWDTASFQGPREGLVRSRRAKAKVAKAGREQRPLTSGQTVRKLSRLMRKPSRSLYFSSMLLSADTKCIVNDTGKPGKNTETGTRSVEVLQEWNLCVNAVDAEFREGERVKTDLTIDSGCAACALPMGVAFTVRMQELNRTLQEYFAANTEKFRELGFKNPTLKIQTSDVRNLKFSVIDKLPKPLVAACKVVAVCFS